MESIDTRKYALQRWLTNDCDLQSATLQTMLNDASWRRYFRVYHRSKSFVAMDAPPSKEKCAPFIAIADALRNLGLKTPEIIKANIDQGFLLLSDFGEFTYLKILNNDNADELYQIALNALFKLQACREVQGHDLPNFTREFMWQEWAWHKEWFLNKLLNLQLGNQETALDQCYTLVVESAASQPQVFMHRDFHSANLMVLPNEEVGLLDFQDAFIGPITYDLVSLLRDCYIDWGMSRVEKWALNYWQQLRDKKLVEVSEQEFLRWFDWMGIERHLKALMTFARKSVRDNQHRYLNYVPCTLAYLLKITRRYSEFAALYEYLNETVRPAFIKNHFEEVV